MSSTDEILILNVRAKRTVAQLEYLPSKLSCVDIKRRIVEFCRRKNLYIMLQKHLCAGMKKHIYIYI